MTDDNITEGTNTSDESMDDSAVIKALREQNRDLKAQLKNAPTRESIEADIRTELERESAISEQLVALGHPKGMSAVLKGQLGDAEVTRESVAEALQSLGYEVADEAEATPGSDDGQSEQVLSDLAKVTDLSSRVRAAASGGTADDTTQRIAHAESNEELAAIAAEKGFLKQHY